MKFNFITQTILLLFLCVTSRAQNDKNIEQFIKKTFLEKNDTIKIQNLYRIAGYYRNIDINKTKFYTEQFGDLAKRISYKKGTAFYHLAIADFRYAENDYVESVKDANRAAELFLEIKDETDYIASIYTACSSLMAIHKYQEAIEAANTALVTANPNNSLMQRGLLYSMKSNAYQSMEQYNEAVAALKKAYAVYEKIDFNRGISDCLYSLCSLYKKIGDYDNALFYGDKFFELNVENIKYEKKGAFYAIKGEILVAKKLYPQGLKYLLLAKGELAKTKADFKYMALDNNINIANAYFHLNDFKKALAVCAENEKLIAKNNPLRANIAYIQGVSYLSLKKNKEALTSLNDGIKLLELYDDPDEKRNLSMKLYEALSRLHNEEQDYKEALSFQQLKFKAEIEHLEKRKNKEITDVLGKYQLGEKNKEIKSLSIQKENETLRAEQRQNQLMITLAVILMTSVALASVYYRFKSSKKNAAILQNKNYEIAAANEKLGASLSEKELLLKEIHHRVKNNLQLVISLLSLQSTKFKSQELNDFLESGTGRIVSMALIHENLYQTDNVASINFKEYAQSLIETIIDSMADRDDVEFSINADEVAFDIEKAIPLGLILNELVVNTIKHNYSSGKELELNVDLKAIGSQYEFTYEDPQSMMTEENTKKSSFGLELIHLLADQLDGKSSLSFTNGLTAKIVF